MSECHRKAKTTSHIEAALAVEDAVPLMMGARERLIITTQGRTALIQGRLLTKDLPPVMRARARDHQPPKIGSRSQVYSQLSPKFTNATAPEADPRGSWGAADPLKLQLKSFFK